MTTESHVRLGEAVQRIPPVAPDTSCIEVRERFAVDARLGSIPIVDGVTPIGIVERGDFLLKLSMTYGNALWANRPVRRLMDAAPIVVERSMAIHEINRVALTNDPTAPVRAIIVVDRGRYCGVCTPMSFLTLNAAALQSGYEDAVRARKQVENAAKAKSDFFARMSHELRTPLNAVIGFSEMILAKPFGPVGNKKYEEYLGDISKSGKHLLRLVNDILSLSRMESQQVTLQAEITSATGLVSDAVRICMPMAKELGVGIVTHIRVEPLALYVDPGRLLQILLNLMSNAIKYTCAGDVVEIGIEPTQDGGAIMRVRDHGPGIEPDVLDRVLEPYWSDESAVLSTARGTGLGLPIARQLAELHGCTLEIASRVGEGTTVSIVMPAEIIVTDSTGSEAEQAVA